MHWCFLAERKDWEFLTSNSSSSSSKEHLMCWNVLQNGGPQPIFVGQEQIKEKGKISIWNGPRERREVCRLILKIQISRDANAHTRTPAHMQIHTHTHTHTRPCARRPHLAEGLCLVGVLHQSRDLLHHSQSPVSHPVSQRHSAQVHHHVLVIIGAWEAKGRSSEVIHKTIHLPS